MDHLLNHIKSILSKTLIIIAAAFVLMCSGPGAMNVSAEDAASGVYSDGNVSYTWELADGAVSITEISSDADKYEVNFPDEINGYPVTSIPWEYFYPNSTITDQQHKNITAVSLPDGITEVPWYVFKQMINLESVIVSENNPGLTVSDGVLFNKDMTMLVCYPACRPGTEYTIPSSVTSIRENAFSHAQYLEDLSFPSGVTNIYGAILNCNSLRRIDLNMVSYVGNTEISGCPNVEKVTVSGDNSSLIEYDNVLYFCVDLWGSSPDGMTLMYYPPGRTEDVYQIPEVVNGRKVTSINDYAFNYCKLREIKFPSSLIKVNNSAFCNNSELNTLVFTEGTKELGIGLMSGCPNFRYMYVPESVTKMDLCTSGGPQDINIYGIPGSIAEAYVSSGVMGCSFKNIEEEKIPQDITLNDQAVADKITRLEDGTLQYSADLADGVRKINFGASARSGVTYTCDDAEIDENGIVTINAVGKSEVKITAVVAEGDEDYFAPTEMTIELVVTDSSGPAPAAQTISGNTKCTRTYGTKSFSLGQTARTALTYKSSNTKIATVTSAGTVTLRSPGTAVITVSAAGNGEYKAAIKKVTIVSNLKTPVIKCKAGKKKVKISWGKVTGAKGYQIYVKYPGKKKYTKVLTTSSRVKAVTHKKLSRGMKYTYKVRAYAKVGGKTYYSKFSKAKKVKVK